MNVTLSESVISTLPVNSMSPTETGVIKLLVGTRKSHLPAACAIAEKEKLGGWLQVGLEGSIRLWCLSPLKLPGLNAHTASLS